MLSQRRSHYFSFARSQVEISDIAMVILKSFFVKTKLWKQKLTDRFHFLILEYSDIELLLY